MSIKLGYKVKPKYERGVMCDVLEFRRAGYCAFEDAIDEVAKRLAKVFNEKGKLEYEVHHPKETGSTGHEIYDSYSSRGTNVVEPNAIYKGYKEVHRKSLAVYVSKIFLQGAVELPKILDLIKENFGEFKIRETKAECDESMYRVFNKNSIDIVFTRETCDSIFKNCKTYIDDFCIVFDGNHTADEYKFRKMCSKQKTQVVY